VRQVLGAIAQFDKATLVAKLKAARDRKRARTPVGGGPSGRYRRKRPKGGQRSLRERSLR
jgi:DNA invertase Pin-like site-specific DNA recombinase